MSETEGVRYVTDLVRTHEHAAAADELKLFPIAGRPAVVGVRVFSELCLLLAS